MRTKTILLIEDDPDSQEMMRFVLERKGFRVVEAFDGMQGLQVAQSELPDLIIMDLSIPILDGFEVARSIKSSERTSHIPIVVMSGYCGEFELKQRALEAGAIECLDKPVDIPAIEVILQKLLC